MSWESNHPSSGGVSLSFGNDENKKLRQEAADRELMKQLLDQGYPSDAAQYIIEKQHETGKLDLNLPTYQNAAMKGSDTFNSPPADEVGLKNRLPMSYDQQGDVPNRPVPLPPVPDIPERSTLADFHPMAQESIAAIDAQNPRNIDFLPIPRGTNVRSTVQVNKPEKQGKPVDSPSVTAAKEVFKSYIKGVQDGFVAPDTYEIMKTAAPALGLSIEELPTPDNPTPSPTFLQKVMGITPTAPPKGPDRTIPSFGKNGKNGANGKQDQSPDLNTKAAQWLQTHHAPATQANIDAVIKAGKVK